MGPEPVGSLYIRSYYTGLVLVAGLGSPYRLGSGALSMTDRMAEIKYLVALTERQYFLRVFREGDCLGWSDGPLPQCESTVVAGTFSRVWLNLFPFASVRALLVGVRLAKIWIRQPSSHPKDPHCLLPPFMSLAQFLSRRHWMDIAPGRGMTVVLHAHTLTICLIRWVW